MSGKPFSGGLYQPRIGLRDVSADRIPDLFLLNPDNVLRMYHNYGDFIFRRVFPSVYDSLPVRRWFRFTDIDADGDDDLFSSGNLSEVMLFRNTGTQADPQFARNADTMKGADGSTVFTQQETVPSFVDIDADGDLDLFYGKVDGSIIFYENTGTAQSPTLTFRTDTYMNILVISGLAKPDEGAATQREQQERLGASVLGFADMNGDADLDILFGDFFTERLLLFHNDGTPQQGKFGMNLADVLFRFDAGQQIVLHRHKALNHTFVVRGEHRLYELDGRLREAHPTGSYTITPASEAPHREGGGAEDAIVLFSMRPLPGEILYEILDDAGHTIAELTLETLQALFEAQQAAEAAPA